MSLREKYAAAKAARPRQMSSEQVEMNYALQKFTHSIPQIIQTAIDRTAAGKTLSPTLDPLFRQETDIRGVVRSYGDMRENWKAFLRCPRCRG